MEITKKGQAVLHCLQQNHAHMTAEDVAEALKKENIAISAATIYRQLEKLVSAGLVRKYVTSPEEPACFQYNGNYDGEAMVREDMFFEFIEIRARDMEESAARGTF